LIQAGVFLQATWLIFPLPVFVVPASLARLAVVSKALAVFAVPVVGLITFAVLPAHFLFFVLRLPILPVLP